jgi:hypothetical protein
VSGTRELNAEALSLLKRQSAKRPQFFEERGLDQLFSIVIELTAEVWVLRERVYAVEDIVTEAGISLRERVEKWQPDPAQAEELAQMRQTMMQTLFRTIDTGEPSKSYHGETADPIPPSRPGTR